jgi:hypothetical protein
LAFGGASRVGDFGAAAGLGTLLAKGGPEATLRRGTTMGMILDRDITFTPAELFAGRAADGRICQSSDKFAERWLMESTACRG